MIFAPRFWLGHLLVVIAVAAAGWLGMWQWSAFEAHRAAQSHNLMNQDPIPLTSVMGPDDPFPAADVGRPVTLSGTWLPDSAVIIERDGERWLTVPVTVGSSAIYVVLGSGTDSGIDSGIDDVEDAIPSGQSSVITGWLQPPEGTGVSDTDPSDNVLPQLRIADLIQHVDIDLYGAFVISTEPIGDLTGVTPDQLPKADPTTGLRNMLYAIEWWIFGLFAVFMWWMWVKEMLNPDDTGAEPGSNGDPGSDPTAAEPSTEAKVGSQP